MRSLMLMVIFSLLCGCTATRAMVAMYRGTDDFRVLELDPRVKYQFGAETNAQIVSGSLDESIKLIEERQYKKFVKPIDIYVTVSEDSFSKYCASRGGGCVLDERLFISPKKENTKERIPRVLTHELSHLQMEQILGMRKWNSNIPSWFREGLAVYASNGAGAENVSIGEARQAIFLGNSFIPNIDGSLFFPKTASYFGLETHMFYRQAEIFVAWLHEQSDAKFKKLLATIQSGQGFEESMLKAYGTGVIDNWNKFKRDIKPNN